MQRRKKLFVKWDESKNEALEFVEVSNALGRHLGLPSIMWSGVRDWTEGAFTYTKDQTRQLLTSKAACDKKTCGKKDCTKKKNLCLTPDGLARIEALNKYHEKHKNDNGYININEATGSVIQEEFQMLLKYLRRYLELYAMFKELDGDDNSVLSKYELGQAKAKLKDWGLKDEVDVIMNKLISKDQNGRGLKFEDFTER